jgi:predicted Zn-dependent peptidase
MTVSSSEVTKKMDVAMPLFNLGFKCEPLGKGEEAIAQEVIGDLAAEVLFGEASTLYLDMYGQGIIDSSFGGGFETIDGCALLSCSGDSDHPEALRDAIFAEAARIAAEGIDEASFLRLKRSAMGRRIRDLDSFDSTCFRLCAYKMTDFDYFRFPEIYNQITASQVQAFLQRVIRPERCSLSVIQTLKEETL